MDINAAKYVILRTHTSALAINQRAVAIELLSGPGLGKSSIVGQAAAELARETRRDVGFVTFMLATISSVDVRGFLFPTKNVSGGVDSIFSTPPWMPVKGNMTVYHPDGSVTPRGEYDGPVPDVGVLFLDEFGQAEDDVKKAAAELLLHGEVGTSALPAGWRVVAASNRMSDKSGVVRAMAFITNRRMELQVNPLVAPWLSWANRQEPDLRPHYLTISFAQKNPDLVFRDAVPTNPGPFCTPRTLCMADAVLRAMRGPEDIKRNRLPLDAIAREACAGLMGSTETAQFYTHMKYADELPDIADIERAPDRAKLPSAMDAQMVCGYMLAHHVNEKNAVPIIKYIERLTNEMQVLAVRAISAQAERASAILATKEIGQWFARHKELFIASKS
jgi:hypothetical protein